MKIPQNQEHLEAFQESLDAQRLALVKSLSELDQKAIKQTEQLSSDLVDCGLPHVIFVNANKIVFRYNSMLKKKYPDKFAPEAQKEGWYYARCFAQAMLQWVANVLQKNVTVDGYEPVKPSVLI